RATGPTAPRNDRLLVASVRALRLDRSLFLSSRIKVVVVWPIDSDTARSEPVTRGTRRFSPSSSSSVVEGLVGSMLVLDRRGWGRVVIPPDLVESLSVGGCTGTDQRDKGRADDGHSHPAQTTPRPALGAQPVPGNPARRTSPTRGDGVGHPPQLPHPAADSRLRFPGRRGPEVPGRARVPVDPLRLRPRVHP